MDGILSRPATADKEAVNLFIATSGSPTRALGHCLRCTHGDFLMRTDSHGTERSCLLQSAAFLSSAWKDLAAGSSC